MEAEKRLKERAHVFVSGRVQGVFFRQRVYELATKLKVNGWVRNTEDDRVEAIFEGERENVQKLVDFCKRGPPYARVAKVDVIWENFTGEFGNFRIRY